MSKLTLILATLSGFAARIVSSSSLTVEDLEAAGVAILAADGAEADVADTLAVLMEDAVNWQQVMPGPAGVLLERWEDPVIRVAARRLAREMAAAWSKLPASARDALVQSHHDRQLAARA